MWSKWINTPRKYTLTKNILQQHFYMYIKKEVFSTDIYVLYKIKRKAILCHSRMEIQKKQIF